MSVLFGVTCIIGIIFMTVFMFIGIWLFIVALKAYNQLRYKNYILEKINQNLSSLCKKDDSSLDNSTLDAEDYIYDNDNENIASFENLKSVKNADSN